MNHVKEKRSRRIRRHRRIRARVKGISEIPRLSVLRSNRHLWVQLIDDTVGRTLCAASDLEVGTSLKPRKKSKLETQKTFVNVLKGEMVGELVAKRAFECGIKRAVFDRGGYKYHGIVKSIAEGARKAGLKV